MSFTICLITVPSTFTHTILTLHRHEFSCFFIICANHATFTSCDIFCWVEAKYSNMTSATTKADFFTFIFCAKSMSGVFDNAKIIFLCKSFKCVHIARATCKMNRNDSFGFWCDSFFNFIYINIECMRVNIY